jgi:hypothetical protein
MLKEQIKKDDIVALKLVSGEEVIAKVVTDNNSMLTVNKPLALIQTPQGIAMGQYILMQDITVPVEISKEKIIVMTKANSVAVDQYAKTLLSSKKIAGSPPEAKIITN